MKKLLFILTVATVLHTFADDAEALKPNITAEQKWQEHEVNRLKTKTQFEDIKEYFNDWIKAIKHSFLLDVFYFKNNKVETAFAQEVLEKFDLDLDKVTIVHKPLWGTPAATIGNTIIIDHHKMAKFTTEEQAFILGHEIIHLKNNDVRTRLMASITLEALIHIFLKYFEISSEHQTNNKYSYWIKWFLLKLFFKNPIMGTISRYQEKRCDIESAKTLSLGLAGASAFEKMRKEWICSQEVPLNPSNFLYQQTIFDSHSHPPLHERSKYLQEFADQQAI